MKKFLILSLCCTSLAAFSQQQFYLKKFSANNSTRYITNSLTVRGIVFFYEVAKDTNNIVMYIPVFKKEDIQFLKDKAVISNSENLLS